MSVKKWIPWNWFKKEEEISGKTVPVTRSDDRDHFLGGSVERFHREIDHLFDQMFRGFGSAPFASGRMPLPRLRGDLLKPTLDLGATDKAYTVTVEIPGVDEKDVKLEIANDTLTISGEKKQENEEKGKNFYRVERSYGSFQRVLSLPEDAEQDGVNATFKKGVLTVTMPRKSLPSSEARQIEITSG